MTEGFELIELAATAAAARAKRGDGRRGYSHRCVHCHRRATVYVWRVGAHRLPVRYCDPHAAALIGPTRLLEVGWSPVGELPGQLVLDLARADAP